MDTDEHPLQAWTSPQTGHGLDEAMLAADPVEQFSGWLDAAVAAGLPEPNAMVLSTVSPAGMPRSRAVLLKRHGPDGFVFYTNRTSTKGQDLAMNPRACLLFPWFAVRRQVIVTGGVSPLSAAESEPYFHARARGSQIGAWASRQSSVIATRAALDNRYMRLMERWPAGTTVPMPDFWGGYRVVPQTVEFWQGRANRLHDRLRYRRDGSRWIVERLAPLSAAQITGGPEIPSAWKGVPVTAQGLIDTTEMYLRTIFELEEEGILPLRARIAERLSQSGPTVSQTVARMERDGLLRVKDDRQLVLTDSGRTLAVRVMRKHRLAECLLLNVIGLAWEDVHIEACRWEHVVSDQVEQKLVELLGYPVRCPHGNLIPGLAELGVPGAAAEQAAEAAREPAVPMAAIASERPVRAAIQRIGEQVQSDADLMLRLKRSGIQPGREVTLWVADDCVQVMSGNGGGCKTAELPYGAAAHIFVTLC